MHPALRKGPLFTKHPNFPFFTTPYFISCLRAWFVIIFGRLSFSITERSFSFVFTNFVKKQTASDGVKLYTVAFCCNFISTAASQLLYKLPHAKCLHTWYCCRPTTTRIRIQTAGLVFGGTGLCSCRVRGVDGSCTKHSTVESYMVIYASNSYTYYY